MKTITLAGVVMRRTGQTSSAPGAAGGRELPGQFGTLLPPGGSHRVVVLPPLPGLHGFLLGFWSLEIAFTRTTLHALESWLTGSQL